MLPIGRLGATSENVSSAPRCPEWFAFRSNCNIDGGGLFCWAPVNEIPAMVARVIFSIGFTLAIELREILNILCAIGNLFETMFYSSIG